MDEEIGLNEKTTNHSFQTKNRRMNGLSNNKRLLIKIIFITLCILPFLYLSVKLILQYFKRETVVKISLEVDHYNPLLAITLCFPQSISIENAIEKYPELKHKFEDYMKTFKNMTESNHENYENSEDFIGLYSGDFDYFINEQNLTAKQLSDRYISSRSQVPYIKIEISGTRRFPNNTIKNFNHEVGGWDENIVPIEYFVFRERDQDNFIDFKCYTYFSHLDREMRKFQINIKDIMFGVTFF